MVKELPVTDEELDQLRVMLEQQLEESRGELHHTQGLQYREHLKREIQVMEALAVKVKDVAAQVPA